MSAGTPKLGIHCQTCQDWGDIVEDENGNPIEPMTCPSHTEPPGVEVPARVEQPRQVTPW